MFLLKRFLKSAHEIVKKKRTNHTAYGGSHDMADERKYVPPDLRPGTSTKMRLRI